MIFVAALLVSLKGTGSNVWSLFRSRAATLFVQGRKTIAAMTKEQAKPLESVASSWNKRIQIDQKNMNILNTYRSYSVNSVIIYRGINMCQLSTTTEWTATANQQKSARDFTEFWDVLVELVTTEAPRWDHPLKWWRMTIGWYKSDVYIYILRHIILYHSILYTIMSCYIIS